ncbi:MAG: MCE family protein [gamma proteobacterium symbiont of Taylorina sp.]|nr:MCE family protein [gamma proteobacterium symbiont of Taylorina sp.]
MDTKINYTLIGIFVFGLSFLLAGFLLWMGKYGFEETSFDHYQIKMSEGVSGLNIESPVKFRGLEIGAVDEIKIDPENPEFININISVEVGTPIKENSIAVLTAQGITGLSYIEIKGGTKDAKNLQNGATISSGKSLFDKLESSATDISEKLVQTMTRIDRLISDKNIASIENLLINLNDTSQQLSSQIEYFINRKNARSIEAVLENTASISRLIIDEEENISQLLSYSITMEEQAVITLKYFTVLSQTINQSIGTIQTKLDAGEFDLRQMSEPHLEAFNALLKELEILSIQATEAVQQLKESPSDILFKQKQHKLGPGEL